MRSALYKQLNVDELRVCIWGQPLADSKQQLTWMLIEYYTHFSRLESRGHMQQNNYSSIFNSYQNKVSGVCFQEGVLPQDKKR